MGATVGILTTIFLVYLLVGTFEVMLALTDAADQGNEVQERIKK